jgi:WD repeat-containing protein 55
MIVDLGSINNYLLYLNYIFFVMTDKKIHLLEPIEYDNKGKIFDLKFSPVNDQLSLVDLTGKLRILSINSEDKSVVKVKNFKVSEESIYSLDYSHDGENILCGNFDGELVMINLEGSKVTMRKKKAQEKTINKVKFIGENMFASSDMTGEIKLFDLRTKKEIFKFKEQEEEISELEYSDQHRMILSTSIDGTLGVFDIRKEGKFKLHALSDCIEDELYCMKIVQGGQKVACGTSEGPIVLFNWDWFGDFKDRILGHPGSVNTLEKYDENFLISGCEDGGVRFVSVTPKYIHSLITDKSTYKTKKNKNFNDVTCISLDKDKRYLAVNTNIDFIKFYDIGDIQLNVDNNAVEEKDEEMNEASDEELAEGDELNEENEEIEDSISDDFDEDDEKSEKENFSEDEKSASEKENESDDGEKDEEDSDDDSDMDSSSSGKIKKSKKTDKTLKMTKNTDTKWLIEKERRKDFFNNM